MIGKKIVFLTLTFSLCFSLKGQTESEIMNQANKFFKDDKFVEATPLYSRLLSLQPKNVDYNYRYGTCLLFNSNNKQEAIRYLKFATDNAEVNTEAHFYMGRAYHLNYLFNDAVRSYDKYASLAGSKEADKKEVSRLIQMCQDGSRLLTNYSELIVYEKREIEADKFFRLYDLKNIGGSLLVTADFQSKIDKKNNHTPLIYFPASATEIFYSSYGEIGDNGKDIYRRLRKASGGWGDPELVRGKVNTQFDEDFAYRSQDGKYLYFCSKGHNSMGGYDVFRSVYDESSDSFLSPENMDFAISSPDDDIFFLVDQNNQNGYFASARQSESGKLYVYKIRVEKLPFELGIIAGVFESRIKQNETISIEVQDAITGKKVGDFSSKDNGEIVLTFPAAGPYKYIMKLSGDTKYYTQTVNIPYRKNIKPLRQKIIHLMENGQETVKVIDRFDENVSEKDDILAALFNDKSKLNPNAQDFDLDKINSLSDQKKILESVSASDLTLSEIAVNLLSNSNQYKQLVDKSTVYQQKTTAELEIEMKKLQDLDKKITANASAYRSSADKSMTRAKLLKESKELLTDRDNTKKKIETLLTVNDKVQENIDLNADHKNLASEWKEKGDQLKMLLSEDKADEALKYIASNKEIIKSGLSTEMEDYHAKTSDEILKVTNENSDLAKRKYNYETSSKDLQNNIDFLERKLYEGNTENGEVTKENIALKRKDLNLINVEIVNLGKTIEENRKIKESLENELAEFIALENKPISNSTASYDGMKNQWNQLKNVPLNADYQLLAKAIEENESSDLTQEINPNYAKSIAAINGDKSKSELSKASALLEAEKENQAAIQKALEANKTLLSNNPGDEKAKRNQETLNSLLQTSNNNITAYNNKYQDEKLKAQNLTYTEATIAQSVDKSYQEIFNYLNDDIVADPLAKLKSLNQHDSTFVTKIDVRIKNVETQLGTNPGEKPLLENELNLLTALKSAKEKDINNRQNKIDDLSNQVASNENNTSFDNNANETTFNELKPVEQEARLVKSIVPAYYEKKDQIVNATSSDDEKLKNVKDLNEALFAGIKTERKKLNKRNDAIEWAALDRLEQNTIDDYEELKIELVSKLESPEKMVNRLAENYDDKIQSIENNGAISLVDREVQIIIENKSLISSLEKEKKKFEKLAEKYPENEKIQLKIESIDQILAEYSQLLASHENKLLDLKATPDLANNPNQNLVSDGFSELNAFEQNEMILEQVNSDYKKERAEIENSKSSELLKTRMLLAVDNKLKTDLESEKQKYTDDKESSKIEAINRLIDTTNYLIVTNENNLSTLESELANSSTNTLPNSNEFASLPNIDQEKEILKAFGPSYESDKATILNSKASELIKTKQLVSLDNNLISDLENALNRLNKDTQAIEIEAVNRLINIAKSSVASNETKLTELENILAQNNSSNPSKSNSFASMTNKEQEDELLSTFNPTYEKEKQEILNSGIDDKLKYNQLITLDNSFLDILINEKSKLNQSVDDSEYKAILRIEKNINADIERNQLNLIAAEETAAELIDRIAKDYVKNKEQLASNPNLSNVEKAKRQTGVDRALIASLEKEKTKFLNLSKSNPENNKLKAKVDFISGVIESKQNEITALSSVLEPIASNNTNTVKSDIVSVEALRNELLGSENKGIMESTNIPKSVEELKKEVSKLEAYEKGLKQKDANLRASNDANSLETEKKLEIIGKEIDEVVERKRRYTITIGDLEQEFIAENKSESTIKTIDHTLEKISNEEKALLDKLDGDITSIKEIKKIENQLMKLSNQKVDRKNEILEVETKAIQKDNDQKLEALQNIPTSSVSQRINLELAEKRVNQLNEESNQLKELAKKSKSREETNELLNKAIAKQEQANEILEITLVDNKVASLTKGKIATLSTKADLEKRRNTLLLEESNLNSEIKNVNADIKVTKKSTEVEDLFNKLSNLEKERQLVVDQIAYIDKKISNLPAKPLPTISPEKKSIELSYREEIEISSSLEYRELSKLTNEAMFLENEISFLLKSIDKDKQDAQKLVQQSISTNNKSANDKAESKVKEIQGKEKRLTDLQNNLSQKQGEIANLFPENKTKREKIENLLLRGVEPIRTSVSNYIAIPETGFEVDLQAAKKENKELAVDTKVPTGLMFRVQVGAFSKPVAEDAFQEFNPVTGEKRPNGLTVYMAGFFDKSISAAEAQKTIRSLGYSDAFVVAYCDGERIPLIEGRKMEASKACAPMQIAEMSIIRTPSPKDTTKLITRELDYNKAIGAAPAVPVELKKGLFYTVQIGVYNRPVDLETLKNITPLNTKRLPNGQIRYSAGVFVSIEEAMPKRKEAIDRGIKDAFITAYYEGERISLGEAEKILREKGPEVIEKTAIGIVKDANQRAIAEENLQKEIVAVEKERFKEGMGIQLVSKETFNEFPRDMLNRFNKHVSFYFDQNDKRLKSIIYTKIEDIPQIHFLREDVDTLFIPDYIRVQKEEKDGFRKIVFYVENGQLDGDVADYIYRLNFRKEYIELGENMKVILHSVPSNSIQPISDGLRNLKIRSVVE